DHGDVDRPVSVLQDFARFRDAGAGHWYDTFDDGRVEGDGQVTADRVDAADHFRNIPRGVALVAGVFALGAVREEEIRAGPQSGLFQQRLEHVFGGAVIRRAFKDYRLALLRGR